MPNFKSIIKDYIPSVKNLNDKRVMTTALTFLNIEPILNDKEISILKEIFLALKQDYTLNIEQDCDTLNFMVTIKKQEKPIIENKHDLKVLYNMLNSLPTEKTNVEDAILIFLDGCEHVEENEVLVINEIVHLLTNSWSLTPIEAKEIKGQNVRCSHFIPVYNKPLRKEK